MRQPADALAPPLTPAAATRSPHPHLPRWPTPTLAHPQPTPCPLPRRYGTDPAAAAASSASQAALAARMCGLGPLGASASLLVDPLLAAMPPWQGRGGRGADFAGWEAAPGVKATAEVGGEQSGTKSGRGGLAQGGGVRSRRPVAAICRRCLPTAAVAHGRPACTRHALARPSPHLPWRAASPGTPTALPPYPHPHPPTPTPPPPTQDVSLLATFGCLVYGARLDVAAFLAQAGGADPFEWAMAQVGQEGGAGRRGTAGWTRVLLAAWTSPSMPDGGHQWHLCPTPRAAQAPGT